MMGWVDYWTGFSCVFFLFWISLVGLLDGIFLRIHFVDIYDVCCFM